MILDFKEKSPQVHESAFVAPDAWVTGDVKVSANVSILFGAAIRGDIEPIVIGQGSNIQDNAVIHTSKGRVPTIIEEDVSVGHGAIIHGATVSGGAMIGMGAVVLDEAVIPKFSLVAARSLVTEGKTFPERSLIMGSPAKFVRELTEEEVEKIIDTARRYVLVGQEYKKQIS